MAPQGGITLSYKEALYASQHRHMSAAKYRPTIKELYHPSHTSGGNLSAAGSTANKIQFSKSPSQQYLKAMGLERKQHSTIDNLASSRLLPSVPMPKAELSHRAS